MGKNFGFQIIQNKDNANEKWIVRKCNIHDTYFSNIENFRELSLSEMTIQSLTRLVTKSTRKDSNILQTDLFRKPTIKEYLELAMVFKRLDVHYNKKTDEITK